MYRRALNQTISFDLIVISNINAWKVWFNRLINDEMQSLYVQNLDS